MKNYILVAAIYLSAIAVSSISLAREMPQRLGIGIKNNTSENLPSLASVYNINGNLSVTGGFGFDTRKDYSATQFQIGVRHIIFHEQNMHFYVGGQLGLVAFENPIDGKNSGFEANIIGGAEFFLPGLENLGFTFEGGLGLASIKNTRVRTIANDPFKAGVIFYF